MDRSDDWGVHDMLQQFRSYLDSIPRPQLKCPVFFSLMVDSELVFTPQLPYIQNAQNQTGNPRCSPKPDKVFDSSPPLRTPGPGRRGWGLELNRARLILPYLCGCWQYLVYADPEEHTEKDDDEEDDIDEIIPTKGLEIVNTHLWCARGIGLGRLSLIYQLHSHLVTQTLLSLLPATNPQHGNTNPRGLVASFAQTNESPVEEACLQGEGLFLSCTHTSRYHRNCYGQCFLPYTGQDVCWPANKFSVNDFACHWIAQGCCCNFYPNRLPMCFTSITWRFPMQ